MKKQIHSYTGEVEYSQCEKCNALYNFDKDECFCEKPKMISIAKVRKMIESIDDSGGGSGRRLKIQLLDKLK